MGVVEVGGATPRRRRVSVAAGRAALVLVVAGMVVAALDDGAAGLGRLSWPDVVLAATFAMVGLLIVGRRPDHRIGPLLCVAGWCSALSVAAGSYADTALSGAHGRLPGAVAAAWLASWSWLPSLALASVFLLLLFPDGRLLGRRWRRVAEIAAGATAIATLGAALNGPDLLGYDVHNPIGLDPPAVVGLVVGTLAAIGIATSIVAAIASVVVRYRRAVGVERRQLWWFTYACVVFGAVLALNVAGQAPDWVVAFGPGLIAASIAISVLRYRLYDIDVIVSRSVVYGALSIGVVLVYVTVVGFLTHLLDHEPGLLGSLLATGVVAVCFQPARAGLERRVQRSLFGDRDDPYRAMSRMARRLEGADVAEAPLWAMAESIADAMRVSYVVVERATATGSEVAAVRGDPTERVMRVPATFRGEVVGALVVADRGSGGALDARDRRLLEDLASQAGIAIHAVGLAADLQRSREDLVGAREEERRRLRRDLHDGLGSALAGIDLRLGALRRTAPTDGPMPAKLSEVQADVRDALAEVRRLVQDLRPPALDERGLAGAIEQHAVRLAASSPSTLDLQVRVVGDVAGLPAAVEVAAYRIALEGLTNVIRHADARRCVVTITRDTGLEVEVRDDGTGFGDNPEPGVGLTSMRERATQLGGSLTVMPNLDGGSRLVARLPVGS